MILFEHLSLRRGTKLLIHDAEAVLLPGQKVAMIGANGCGKSSLFALLLGELTADEGNVRGLESLRLAHMAQEVAITEAAARDYVVAGDQVLDSVFRAIQVAEETENYDVLAGLHQQLETLDGYSAHRRADRLLVGLGFTAEQCGASIATFSGGWRIRLNLARALMTPSDLLLLDEPTNHLDLDATLWLQSWLQAYEGTLLMISHDRDFIDATCDRIMRIEAQSLITYKGGYSDYEIQRAERLTQQQSRYEKQQQRISEINDFVRRFRAKATKARQAQSRLKELERMEQMAPAHIDSPFYFAFPEPGKTSDPLLVLEQASLGYAGNEILGNVSLRFCPGDRVGLIGRNGAGKSTLLKSLTGKLPLLSGERTTGTHLRIGYFDQQQLEVLDLAASPLLHVQRLTPGRREQEILDFLGGFQFKGEAATSAIGPFSGGEKARLALALVVWQNPNLLILDEPTNHLDLEMRHALEVAINGFEGALVLVSHDRHLLRNAVEDLILVEAGKTVPYDQDLASYEQWILSSNSSKPNTSATDKADSRKEQRQDAADRRAKMKPLKKAIEKAEREIHATEQKLAAIKNELADSSLYEDDKKDALTKLLKSEGALKNQLQECEANWLEHQAALETLEG